MARTNDAIATDPVLFYRLDGVLEEIPIGEIYFDGPNVKTDRVPGPNDLLLQQFLEYLAARGDLKPSPAPPPPTALRVFAKRAGSATNHITVVIEPATNTDLVNITVRQIDLYKDLTLGDLNVRLGTATPVTVGTDDGLIRVKTNPAVVGMPDPARRDPVPLDAPAPAAPTWTIASLGLDKVTLELTDSANLGTATFTLAVLNPRPAGGGARFDVRVECKIEFLNVAFGGNALPGALTAANYLVDFRGPDPAPVPPATYPLPRPATITLAGGADRVDATAAKGTLVAKT